MFKYVAVVKTKEDPFGYIMMMEDHDEAWFITKSVDMEANISVYEIQSGNHIMTYGGIL